MQALENKKRIEEEQQAEEKKQVWKKDEILKQLSGEEKLQDEHIKEQDTAKELINEASRKLSAAITDNSMSSDKVAQVMLSAGNDKLQETSKKIDAVWLNVENLRKGLATFDSMEKKASDEPAAKKRKKEIIEVTVLNNHSMIVHSSLFFVSIFVVVHLGAIACCTAVLPLSCAIRL
jgi:hypothetical protein